MDALIHRRGREDHREMMEITGRVIGAALKVHQKLGPGLLESAYEACLDYQFAKNGLLFERQKPLPLIYEDVRLDCGYRLDFVIEKSIIVEIKSVESILPIHIAQLLSYLRLSGLQIGLLINFKCVYLRMESREL